MPYINVKITRDGVTADQKAAIIRGMTDVLVEVLGKDPKFTHVVIDEVEPDNWGFAGMTTTAFRSQAT